jgi:hypothetical protein
LKQSLTKRLTNKKLKVMKREEYIERLEQAQVEYPHLEIVESNDNLNGYPSGIRLALLGFNDVDEVEEVADKYFDNSFIFEFDRKDGSQFYTRRYNALRGYGIDVAKKLGDTYELFHGTGDEYFEEYAQDTIIDFAKDVVDIDDILELVKAQKEIIDEANNKGDDEAIVIHEGHYVDTIDSNPVSFSHDTHNYYIGIVAGLFDD